MSHASGSSNLPAVAKLGRSRLPERAKERQLAADLSKSLADSTDVNAEAWKRAVMGIDASHYVRIPEVVLTPSSGADVARILKEARKSGQKVTFRAGGTSLSGQASGDGLLVDVRKNFKGVHVLAEGHTVEAAGGATIRKVNAHLRAFGRKLGPDPASEIAATIGGVVANNSSGMACGTEYNTYNTLDSLVFILPSGTRVDTAHAGADSLLRQQEPEIYAGLEKLRDFIRSSPELEGEVRRQYLGKNTMGYGLNSFLDFDEPVKILEHLLVGSEGTLAFIEKVRMRSIPVPPLAVTGVAVFSSTHAAASALPSLIGAGADVLELMDSGSLRSVEQESAIQQILNGQEIRQHAALLIEFHGSEVDWLEEKTARASKILDQFGGQGFSPTTNARERGELWKIRKGLYASVAGNRESGTTALLEDIAVPVEQLADTCDDLQSLFLKHGYSDGLIFGHAKDGNIHFLITEDFSDPGAARRQASFIEDLVQMVLDRGGTLKAEHGTGRIMAPFVERQFGAELYSVMKEVKQLADPKGILNPGVMFAAGVDDYLSGMKITPDVEEEVTGCVECGYCEPTCPSRDLTMTPRQRIAMRRARAEAVRLGDWEMDRELADAEVYQSIETCAVDGLCELACPLGINTGDLTRRLRSERVNGVEEQAWKAAATSWGTVVNGASMAMSVAGAIPLVANAATKGLRLALGDDTVPLWTRDLPKGGMRRTSGRNESSVVPPRKEVVFFSACVGTMFAPAAGGIGVAEAVRRLSARAGITLITPPNIGSLCCGTPWKSKGLLSGYQVMVKKLREALRTASNDGELSIICDNSSCTEGLVVALEGEGLRVEDAVQFVDREILPKLTERDSEVVTVVHPTCSSTRLGTNDAMVRISEFISARTIVPTDWGCCAFAGDRGMLHPELTASATRAESSEVSRITPERLTEIQYASCNRTCEMGISRATGEEYRHILEILEEVTRP